MKAVINKVKTKNPRIKFSELKPGRLYNFKMDGDNGVVLACEGANAPVFLVELKGMDAALVWEPILSLNGCFDDVEFTEFTDSLTISN